jgi:hypothetical protein
MWAKLVTTLTTWAAKVLVENGPRVLKMGMAFGFALYALWSGLLSNVFEMMWTALPDDLQTDFTEHKIWLEYVNAWFPLAELLAIVIAVYTFKSTVFAVKLILKLIPFIG